MLSGVALGSRAEAAQLHVAYPIAALCAPRMLKCSVVDLKQLHWLTIVGPQCLQACEHYLLFEDVVSKTSSPSILVNAYGSPNLLDSKRESVFPIHWGHLPGSFPHSPTADAICLELFFVRNQAPADQWLEASIALAELYHYCRFAERHKSRCDKSPTFKEFCMNRKLLTCVLDAV